MSKAAARKPAVKTFSALLERTGNNMNWTHILLPFDSVRLWGTRGTLRVKGDINGFAFRTSLFPTGDGHHTMIVNKQMQKNARVTPGMTAEFRLERDLESSVTVPPEFQRLLRTSRRLEKYFLSLSLHIRNFVVSTIAGAKQAETRVRRAERAAEHLMEVMEAETELPPIIRQAFARNPQAMKGWERLSPSHRRGHLFGIFHYRDHDARLRRIEKTMEEMIDYAERRS